MTTIKIPDDTKAAILITLGDTDKDGKVGVRPTIYADIPFDGKGEVAQILTLPEIDDVPLDKIPDVIALISSHLLPALGPITKGLAAVKNLLGR